MRWIERFRLLALEQRMKVRKKKRNNEMDRKISIISFRTTDEDEGEKKRNNEMDRKIWIISFRITDEDEGKKKK